MTLLTHELATSEFLAVTGASAPFTTDMLPGEVWEYVCDVASWIKQGATPTASAGSGSMYVPAGRAVLVEAAFDAGENLAAIRAVGSGSATLTRMRKRDLLATSND